MPTRVSELFEVLALFVIPIGGGIPAGVLLAKSKGIGWIVTALLYLVSDILLACVFDPMMWFVAGRIRKSPNQERILSTLRASLQKTIPKLGVSVGPLSLILIAFGTDPMTGRVVTAMAGHGFITGWAISIAGDMIFFALIMASTLWLNGILGDGTLTTFLVLAGMFGIPPLFRKIREKLTHSTQRSTDL